MASVSVSMSMPSVAASSKNRVQPNKLAPVKVANSKANKLRVKASLKERAVAGITAVAVAAAVAVPEAALAAESLTPSLKNFMLSIAAGGVVLGVIAGAVVGVSNFDPVKRG